MIKEGSIKIPFNYAAGRAGTRFLEELRDSGRILASRCRGCEKAKWPPRSFCPACGGDDMEWVEVGPGGTLVSATELPGKGTFCLVQLEGAAGVMLHRLISNGRKPAAGSRVRARLRDSRKGSITDIEGFAVEGGGK